MYTIVGEKNGVKSRGESQHRDCPPYKSVRTEKAMVGGGGDKTKKKNGTTKTQGSSNRGGA